MQEGYKNAEQNEMFQEWRLSVFTTTCYLRGVIDENENVSITSEVNDHSCINAYTCTKKVIYLVRDKQSKLLFINMKPPTWSNVQSSPNHALRLLLWHILTNPFNLHGNKMIVATEFDDFMMI